MQFRKEASPPRVVLGRYIPAPEEVAGESSSFGRSFWEGTQLLVAVRTGCNRHCRRELVGSGIAKHCLLSVFWSTLVQYIERSLRYHRFNGFHAVIEFKK